MLMKKVIKCHQCKENPCLAGYPNGMPEYCQANNFHDLIQETKPQYLDDPNVAKMHLATAKILKRSNYLWPRIREAIELAKGLGIKKVGLAVCIGLLREGREFARFLERAGLEVYSVACMIGGLEARETGVPEDLLYGAMLSCNPIAQAEILNAYGTELNYMYGLCTGHDSIFIRFSKAPVTCVVAKDVVTANNPSGILWSGIHRERLWRELGS